MKPFFLAGLCVVILSGLLGCQKEETKPLRPEMETKGLNGPAVEVVIEGAAKFPEELVGRWKAEGKSGWEIVFDNDGSISSAIVEFGNTMMVPGQVTTYPTKYGGKGIFEPGKWKVDYQSEGRELGVNLEVARFYQDMGNHAVEGSIDYILIGSVSQDWTQWTVDWFGKYKITALMPDPVVLENMEQPEYKGMVVFKKITGVEE